MSANNDRMVDDGNVLQYNKGYNQIKYANKAGIITENRENQYDQGDNSRFPKNIIFIVENTIVYMLAWDFYRTFFDSKSAVVSFVTNAGGYIADFYCCRTWNDCGLWKV